MAVRVLDELLSSFKERMGETPSDSDLAFVEDLSDTFSDLDTKVRESGDWKIKYEENDASWRKKYAERFYNPGAAETGNHSSDTFTESGVDTDVVSGRYEDLFKTDTSTWR